MLFGQDNIFEIIEYADEGKKSVYRRTVNVNGSPIYWRHKFWEYVPVSYIYSGLNRFADEFVEKIYQRWPHLRKKFILDIMAEIHNYWGDIVKIHKELKEKEDYKNVNENNMSLMLYSGIRYLYPYCVCRNIFNGLTPCLSSSIFIEAIKRDGNRRHLSGCLYVGDMEREEAFEELQKIGNRFGNIGIIQLSHHGDENEMNDKLMELNAPYAFCCFGSKNTYHHPGWRTISQCLENGIIVYPISETSHSFIQQICIY